MSRNYTSFYPFIQRMIRRRFLSISGLSLSDAETLWLGMAGFGNRPLAVPASGNAHLLAEIEHLRARNSALRYRIADRLNSSLKWLPAVHSTCRLLLRALRWVRGAVRRVRMVAAMTNRPVTTVVPEVEAGSRVPLERGSTLDARSRKVA
jgi:hypothetical protein